MSKKTDSSEIEEVKEDTVIEKADVPKEAIKENPKIEPVIVSPKVRAKPKRYGLERFLQLYPQSPSVEAILRMQYAGAVMTAEEWLNLIETILLNKPRAKSIGGNKNGR